VTFWLSGLTVDKLVFVEEVVFCTVLTVVGTPFCFSINGTNELIVTLSPSRFTNTMENNWLTKDNESAMKYYYSVI
jgi:hypothetical protein